jgi:Zn-dependent peptidase ImmA (M78 family)/transcriptional regulator with XRE-family HTH domain
VVVAAFVPERLKQARAFRGLTLTALADQINVSFGLISHFEKGLREPSVSTTEALAQVLGFRPGFFSLPQPDIWTEEQCSFRRRVATSDTVKRRARAHGTLVTAIVEHLQEVLDFPRYDVPEIPARRSDDIIKAAERCRVHWGLGVDRPIVDMGRVLENAGVLLVRHFAHSDQIDAFCRRGRAISVVVLNTTRASTSRLIFDMAHELGHLVMHTGIPTGAGDTETDAHQFAAAFGMPPRAFRREFRAGKFSWTRIFDLKARWRFSAGAIIRHARRLGLIDAVTYHRAYKEMSWKGWLKNEPGEPDLRGPELLASAFKSLQDGTGETVETVCEALQMELRTFIELTGIEPPSKLARVGPRRISGSNN